MQVLSVCDRSGRAEGLSPPAMPVVTAHLAPSRKEVPRLPSVFLEVGELRYVRRARAGISVRRLILQTVAEIVGGERSGK